MAMLYFIVPALTVDHVIQLRRSQKTKDQTRDICDFIWVCLQPDSEKWQSQIQHLWTNVRAILTEQQQQQQLEDLFSGLSV